MPDEAPRQFEIDLPPELIGGAYADFANVWHTPTVFVMDFLTLARSRGARMSPMMASGIDMSPPAPSPWMARNTASSVIEVEKLARIEPITKMTIAKMNSGLRPKMSDSLP